MIRYRRLYESEDSDIKLYDVVKCADCDWYVIDKQGDIVTLLAAYTDYSIGQRRFDGKSNEYKTSEIREYLKNRVLPKLQSANPIPTRLNDVGCIDKVWLLSVDEAEDLPLKISKCDYHWWLRSPGFRNKDAAYVGSSGGVNAKGSFINIDFNGIRPAIRVRIEDLD